jgi:hypothetical protein
MNDNAIELIDIVDIWLKTAFRHKLDYKIFPSSYTLENYPSTLYIKDEFFANIWIDSISLTLHMNGPWSKIEATDPRFFEKLKKMIIKRVHA